MQPLVFVLGCEPHCLFSCLEVPLSQALCFAPKEWEPKKYCFQYISVFSEMLRYKSYSRNYFLAGFPVALGKVPLNTYS